MEVDQDVVFKIAASDGAAVDGKRPEGRARDLAASVLGTHDPRCSGLCHAHGLCSLQSGEAWVRGSCGGLAIFIVPTMCSRGDISVGLAREQSRTWRCWGKEMR